MNLGICRFRVISKSVDFSLCLGENSEKKYVALVRLISAMLFGGILKWEKERKETEISSISIFFLLFFISKISNRFSNTFQYLLNMCNIY